MTNTLQLAVVMDPIESIKIHKDSTFAMLLEAQRRNWNIYYILPHNIFTLDGQARCRAASLSVEDDPSDWFKLGTLEEMDLSGFDIILMRQDPPFDMEYIYITYALELAQRQGVCVVNNPLALRNMNEKFSITNFPQCCTTTLVSRDIATLEAFIDAHQDVVVKPLDAMGGQSIFRISPHDANKTTILDQVTRGGARTIMAQKFIPEISLGDKRILLVNGEPVPYALARIPKEGEFRGNLALGGSGRGVPLSDKDRWICGEIKTSLLENGILFAGIDVIGSYLTEINITSPTCIRELDAQFDLNISSMLFDSIDEILKNRY